jgi:hypothetical protein
VRLLISRSAATGLRFVLRFLAFQVRSSSRAGFRRDFLLLPVHHRSTATWNLVLFPDPLFHLCVLDLLVGLRSSQHWHSTLRFGLVPSGIALLLACCAPTILPAVSFLPRLTLLGLLLVVSVASVCAKSKPCHLILPPPAFVLRSKLHSLVPI